MPSNHLASRQAFQLQGCHGAVVTSSQAFLGASRHVRLLLPRVPKFKRWSPNAQCTRKYSLHGFPTKRLELLKVVGVDKMHRCWNDLHEYTSEKCARVYPAGKREL